MEVRRATHDDLEDAAALLRSVGLPPLADEIPPANVLVALDGARVVGVIAVQVVVRRGLARTAAVDPACPAEGVGASLLRSLVARAHELGLRELYLLAEHAEPSWASMGFAAVPHDAVPWEVRAARTYRHPSPEPATVLRLALATRL